VSWTSAAGVTNSQKRVLGRVTGWDAFAESLNTVSAESAWPWAGEAYRYVRLFGFGKPARSTWEPVQAS
jgi:hypothetical protein